jgi:hypothetical protein
MMVAIYFSWIETKVLFGCWTWRLEHFYMTCPWNSSYFDFMFMRVNSNNVAIVTSNWYHSTLRVYDFQCLRETDAIPTHLHRFWAIKICVFFGAYRSFEMPRILLIQCFIEKNSENSFMFSNKIDFNQMRWKTILFCWLQVPSLLSSLIYYFRNR